MDKEYWVNYYSGVKSPSEPSNFALSCLPMMKRGQNLLELGCGNGRDSIFFSKNNIDVTAIDQAENIIGTLKKIHKSINFVVDDFVTMDSLASERFTNVYSRFSLHSINSLQEDVLIKRVYDLLTDRGKFFVETRCIEDEIFGLGTKISENEFIYEGHYRRFINKDSIVKKLENNGYEINLAIQEKGFAQYESQDPIVLRIVAQKK